MTDQGIYRRSLLLFIISVLLLGALALPGRPVRAAGATYTVTSLGDTGAGSGLSGDLRYALTRVNAGAGGDTITFAVAGTIALTRALPVISKDVTLTGPGADSLAISGNQMARVLAIDHDVAVGISGLTITGGHTTGDPQVFGGPSGGGIFTSFSVRLTLTDCVVGGNVAAGGGGGGIYIGTGSSLTLERSTIRGNTAMLGVGGGIDNAQGAVRIHASRIAENVAGDGADGVGGGIYGTGGVVLDSSTIHGNTAGRGATGRGGGVAVESFHADLQIVNSTISGNMAGGAHGGGLGGGIYTSQPARITNSTITGNTAGTSASDGQGGGIYTRTVDRSHRTELASSTIARNSATGTGGGIAANFVAALDTVVAGNSAPGGPDLSGTLPELSGTLISRGHNLIGDTRGTIIIDTDPTNLIGVDPLLGPLGDNGGPTQTLPLLPGSPALDAVPATGADCPATDQRGVARPQGPACDIGAYELRVVGSPISLAPTALPDGTPGLPYAATLTASGGSGTGYTFAVTAGALPPGLTLSGDGVLAGTPTTKGTYRFTVTVGDSGGNNGERGYTVVIGPAIPLPVRAE